MAETVVLASAGKSTSLVAGLMVGMGVMEAVLTSAVTHL